MKWMLGHRIMAVAMLLALPAQAGLYAEVRTSAGSMWFELDTQNTPNTVANFSRLAKQHWYEHKAFYRVVAGHVIQAGLNDDNHPDMQKYAVVGEFHGKFSHQRGCLGLARGDSPDSGSTEIYICHANRPHLDGRYAVFGRLIHGQQVLDAIAGAPVDEIWLDNPSGQPIAFHHPKSPVEILNMTVLHD